MRKPLSLLLSLLLTLGSYAQQEPVDQTIMQKIRAEAFEHSQIATIAHQLTDVAGARLTNSPGYIRASRWAVQALQQWGVQHAFLEPWGKFGKGWSTEHVYIALKKPYYQPLIAYPKAWTHSTNGPVTGKVILLDTLSITAIDKLGTAIKGKIVLENTRDTLLTPAFNAFATRYTDDQLNNMQDKLMINNREEIVTALKHFREQAAARKYLASKGALALLSTDRRGRDGTLEVSGRAGYAEGFDLPLPEMVLAKEDYLRLRRLVRSSVPVNLEMDIRNKWYTDDLRGYNVIAEIPGTDINLRSEVVIIGAHLDSWHSATGATDNAAGCIVIMEVMRILKSLGIQPRRTIRIALWGGEEQGLLGSFNYVKNHFGDPLNMKLTPAQKQISAYFNLDNGSGKIRGIFLQNNDTAAPIFNSWLQPFADLGATTVTNKNTGQTDHLSFDAVGIPGFQFIQDPLEYQTRTHHTNMDTYDHLQMEDLKQAATIVAAIVYNTAMRNDKLPRKPLPPPNRFLFDLDYPL